jgi:hypothetical protein
VWSLSLSKRGWDSTPQVWSARGFELLLHVGEEGGDGDDLVGGEFGHLGLQEGGSRRFTGAKPPLAWMPRGASVESAAPAARMSSPAPQAGGCGQRMYQDAPTFNRVEVAQVRGASPFSGQLIWRRLPKP